MVWAVMWPDVSVPERPLQESALVPVTVQEVTFCALQWTEVAVPCRTMSGMAVRVALGAG